VCKNPQQKKTALHPLGHATSTTTRKTLENGKHSVQAKIKLIEELERSIYNMSMRN